MVKFGQRVSELEGIRLKNGIVPCGHNFDPTGSSLTRHIRHTRVHLPCKFWVSATVSSKKVSSSCCFAKGSRGGTWHVPRGTWRHVTNAIVVPALWRIEWCLSGPDRLRRSGAINESPWTNSQTDIHTHKHHPPNVNFDPHRSKSSFLRMDFVHSSSLRFWTSGRHYFILPWVQNRNCLNQKIQKSKFRKFKILTPLIFGPP